MSAADDMEKGRAWIIQEAKRVAKDKILPIENLQWMLDSREDTKPPEQKLCFDLGSKRHSVSFADAEIEDCADPVYLSKRPLVTQRLLEEFQRLSKERE